MIFTLEQEQQLAALRVYAISCGGRLDPARDSETEWLGRELTVTVTLSGYGTSNDKSTPTWQASATDSDIESAFTRALTFAPAQRAEADARAQGRLNDILPEYDPDGTRFKKQRRARTNGPKISAEELAKLLGL